MNNPALQPSVENVANDIKRLTLTDDLQAEELIEGYLSSKLQSLSMEEKHDFLKRLCDAFDTPRPKESFELNSSDRALTFFFSLLLGQKITASDLSSQELSLKLAHSLNTVFDSLNELVAIINSTLLGEEAGLQTIRHIISADLRAEGESQSLGTFLSQIKEAFLIANLAFKSAARNEVSKILTEFDPDHIASEAEKGLKFGFMRKAELFEVFREKFEQFNKWFQSERFVDEFSRQFEKECQRLYLEKGGRNEKEY